MQIKYSPQRCDKTINYEFNGEVITSTLENKTDVFDFSNLPNGELGDVETALSINPIISAKRENGELYVNLLYWYGKNATKEELYPSWRVIVNNG